jgi:DNA (cytosine-5)-methyltransferase 1
VSDKEEGGAYLFAGDSFVMFFCLDLFAGAGGITEGFKKAGFTSICANDFDEDAKRTFTYNHSDTPYIMKDVRELSFSDIKNVSGCKDGQIDVITGGPPCQGFSVAGLRIVDDPRNKLFREYVRITNEVKPKVIFFENVHGIMNMQNGRVLKAVVEEYNRIGYDCMYSLVNAADYGVPQSRPRFVLIAVRGFDKKLSFPQKTHADMSQFGLMKNILSPYLTVDDALSDLPYIDQGEGSETMIYDTECRNDYQKARRGHRKPGTIYNHRATRHAKFIQERYAKIPQGCTNAVLPPEIRTKKINVYKLDQKKPSRTVTCNFRTDLLHPTIPRGLTVREAARLQSFDDDYCFFGNLTRKARWLTQDDQVGNAVPPLMAYAFAKHIKEKILNQF